jgi:hypothetical protein
MLSAWRVYRSTQPWASPAPVESLWAPAPEISILGSFSTFLRTEKLGADEIEDLINHQSGLFAILPSWKDVIALVPLLPVDLAQGVA